MNRFREKYRSQPADDSVRTRSGNGTFIRRQIMPPVLLLVICLVAFANTLPNDFMWDDPYLIAENPYLRDYTNIPLFFTPYYWDTMHPYADGQALYRPLRTLTFAIDYHFWGLNPAGYHLTNLLLHMINVTLVFFLVSVMDRRLTGARRTPVSVRSALMRLPFLTAVLFAIHPIHTESVTYIKNRSDLLSFLFFVSAVLLFIEYRPPLSLARRLLMTAGSWLCFALALLSKEMALTLPAVLVLFIACFTDRPDRGRALVRVLPYGLLALLALWFRQTMLSPVDLPGTAVRPDLIPHFLAVIKTVGIYLWLLVFPFNLNAERPFAVPQHFWDPGLVFALIMLAGVTVLAGRARSRNTIVFFSIAYVLVTILPAANIVFLASRPIAEQRLYIPSLGFCLLPAWGLYSLYHRESQAIRPSAGLAMVTAALIVAVYGMGTIHRNRDWRDPITFYTRTIQSNPDSPRIYNNLGIALAEQGRSGEAIANYEIALSMDPAYDNAWNNLGVELAETARLEEAVKCYEKALAIKPDYASAHYNLGTALMRLGRLKEAVQHSEAAVRLKPSADMLNNLGLVYAADGRLDEAVDSYLRALGMNPDYILVLNNLGATLVEAGDIDQTVDRLLSHVLSDRQLARVYNSSASLLLKAGDRTAAVRYYREAVRLDPVYMDGLYNLGLALVLSEQYGEAAGVFDRVLAMCPDEETARKRRAYCLKMMAGRPE